MSSQPRIGIADSVSIIAHIDATQRAIPASVRSVVPFQAESGDPNCRHLGVGSRVILLHRSGNRFTKAEGIVQLCLSEGERWFVEFQRVEWEQLDRRRYPRFDQRVPVRIRSANEHDNVVEIATFESSTRNLSLGGAWIDGAPTHEAGSLVEVELRIPGGEAVRTFGIIAWQGGEESGFGVEFLEFIGASRYYLQEHLSRAA